MLQTNRVQNLYDQKPNSQNHYSTLEFIELKCGLFYISSINNIFYQ